MPSRVGSTQERPSVPARIAEAIGGRANAGQFERSTGGRFKRLTLQSWVDGRTSPTVGELEALAAATGRTLASFIGDASSPQPVPAPPPGVVRIAMIDARASGGPGAWNEHAQEIGGVPFPVDWLRRLGGPGIKPDQCDFLRLRGDSMAPTIADNALVLVNRGDTAPPLARSKKRTPNDDIFVFGWNDEVKIKRLTRQPGENLAVISDNSLLYPPEVIPAHDPLTVYGRVIWWDNRL